MPTVLRELEECARVALSDEAYDVGSVRSSPSRVLSPTELSDVRPTDASFSGSRSCVWVGGASRSLFWDEEEDYFNVGEENEHVPRAAGAMGGSAGSTHRRKRASERPVSRKEWDRARGTDEPRRRDLSGHGNNVTERRLLTSGDRRGRESRRKPLGTFEHRCC